MTHTLTLSHTQTHTHQSSSRSHLHHQDSGKIRRWFALMQFRWRYNKFALRNMQRFNSATVVYCSCWIMPMQTHYMNQHERDISYHGKYRKCHLRRLRAAHHRHVLDRSMIPHPCSPAVSSKARSWIILQMLPHLSSVQTCFAVAYLAACFIFLVYIGLLFSMWLFWHTFGSSSNSIDIFLWG